MKNRGPSLQERSPSAALSISAARFRSTARSETVNKEIAGTKRTLTVLAGSSALIGVIAAIVRAVAVSQIHDFTHPLIGLLGIGMILSLLVALLALNTRLQVAFDESGYQPATESEQNEKRNTLGSYPKRLTIARYV